MSVMHVSALYSSTSTNNTHTHTDTVVNSVTCLCRYECHKTSHKRTVSLQSAHRLFHTGAVETQWIRFGSMWIECALNQSTYLEVDCNQIRTEFIVYLSNNNKIMHDYAPQTATFSKLSLLGHQTCCIHRPRYKLQWPIMLECYWLDAS